VSEKRTTDTRQTKFESDGIAVGAIVIDMTLLAQ
jgi:hypothetical protein